MIEKMGKEIVINKELIRSGIYAFLLYLFALWLNYSLFADQDFIQNTPIVIPLWAGALAIVLNEFKTTKSVEKYLAEGEYILHVPRYTRLLIFFCTYFVVCFPFAILIAFLGYKTQYIPGGLSVYNAWIFIIIYIYGLPKILIPFLRTLRVFTNKRVLTVAGRLSQSIFYCDIKDISENKRGMGENLVFTHNGNKKTVWPNYAYFDYKDMKKNLYNAIDIYNKEKEGE